MAAEFHTLEVVSVEPLTDASVAIGLAVPPELADAYRFIPGQHVIVRRDIDGEDVRRSYSICTSANSGDLRVAVKRLEGGAFSTFANQELAVGDRLEVTPPVGDFTIATDPGHAKHYLAIAAGSGITPVMSMIATVLEDEPNSNFTLVFGNRNSMSVMFLDELGALKDRFTSRFVLVHILSREANAIPLFDGRIDVSKLEELFTTVIDPDSVDGWYLCGPAGMVEAARKTLVARGVGAAVIHDELFYAGDEVRTPIPADDPEGSTVRFTLNGRTSMLIIDPEGAPILDHALAARPDAPFSCRSGACASCRAMVTEGEVRMDRNWALSDDEVAAGHVLTCQSHPVSETVELTYDL
jgi:ring-1,2-phenylacetyl-CoA epoxidase subunit PaaE